MVVRTLPQLLAELGASDASEVEVRSLTPAGSATPAVAHQNARTLASGPARYEARRGTKIIMIDEAEAATLRSAGAMPV